MKKTGTGSLLAVDVGNTSTAIGLWSESGVRRVSHIDGALKRPGDVEKAVARCGAAEAMAYASVVPKAEGFWRALAARRGLKFVKITHKTAEKCGIALDYPHPGTVGADRLADAAGALKRYGAPVMVCDFGTAFTAAVITRDGVWRGGVIAPGFPLMRDYLAERTAKLPRLPLSALRKLPKIGKSTREAMIFGIVAGYRGMVREIAGRLAANFDDAFRIVATGGFAAVALEGMPFDYVIDPTLTLYGTGLIAKGVLK